MDDTHDASPTPIAFASYPNHHEYDMEAGPLRRVHLETVDCSMLTDLQFLPSHAQVDPRDYPAVEALVVERTMRGTTELLVHVYSLSQVVVEHLEQSTIDLLQEDACLLKFAVTSKTTLLRHSVHRAVSALKKENATLRSRIRQLEAQHASAAPPQQRESHVKATAPAGRSSSGERPETHHGGDGVPRDANTASNVAALPLHSPLSWDMETEAMVNARTAYDPYRPRCKGGVNMRLDTVTQSQMVARLHDRSVDQRDRRRRDNEQLVLRELGLQERRVLTMSDQQDMAVRLHDQSMSRARDNMKKLQTQYLPAPEKRSLSPQQQKESACRMHDEAMAHARKSHDKLFQDHVLARELETRKLSGDEQKAMADRLSKRAAQA